MRARLFDIRAVALTVLSMAWLSGAPAFAVAVEPAGAPQSSSVRLAELIGTTTAELRDRLESRHTSDNAPPALSIDSPDGELTFLSVDDLLETAAVRDNLAIFRTHGDQLTSSSSLMCKAELLETGATLPQAGYDVLLVFKNERLQYALSPERPHRSEREPAPATSSDMEALRRRPVASPFLDAPGQLSMEDGLGFLARLERSRLDGDARLSVHCEPQPSPRSRPQASPRPGLDAGDLQGLALLPFAFELQGKNRQRVRARKEGAIAFASLRVGSRLGGTPQAYARAHAGMRAYSGRQPGYAVLSIDMGGYPGRNLTNFNDTALVGVRDGRVVWTSPPGARFGPFAGLLCLDAHNLPAAPRPGCSGWGQFTP